MGRNKYGWAIKRPQKKPQNQNTTTPQKNKIKPTKIQQQK
jgi:hypothetical protein